MAHNTIWKAVRSHSHRLSTFTDGRGRGRSQPKVTNLLGLHSHGMMMVAAHQEDLRATQALGMQAAFVLCPLERCPSHMPDLTHDLAFEVVATDFVDLAQQLGTR